MEPCSVVLFLVPPDDPGDYIDHEPNTKEEEPGSHAISTDVHRYHPDLFICNEIHPKIIQVRIVTTSHFNITVSIITCLPSL